MNRTKITSVVVAALIAGGLVTTTTAAANPDAPGQTVSALANLKHTLKYFDGGKSKREEWTNPAGKVVFRADVDRRATVKVIEHPEDPGLTELSVKPYDPTSDEEVEAMAAELTTKVLSHRTAAMTNLPDQAQAPATPPGLLKKAGANRPPPRLVGVDAAAPLATAAPTAGAGTGSTAIYDVGCLYLSTEAYAKGCYYRRAVPESMLNWYLRADSSELYGHHSGTWGSLKALRSIHDYDTGYPGTEIIQSRPAVTRDGDGCRESSIGVSYGVFSASMPVELCPDRLDPYQRATYFRHAWYGSVVRDTVDRGTVGHSITMGRVGHGIGFDYRIQTEECDGTWNPFDVDGITCDWRTAG